jgi:eukaryotic-like serine/threonine-protein kinase
MMPGTKLGPYEILSSLGTGGMGEVYRARDTRLDRIVAIKILPNRLSDRPELRERFEREARTIASLNHPHICTLYDIGHQDGTDYLVMECLEGETLADRLAKGPLPLDQVLRYAIEISDALDKTHRKGVTHRDLKPGNIMLTKSGAKLLDFGLAKLRQEASPAAAISQLPTTNKYITAQGTIVGTLQYMAPEQLEGREVDARTDIFAFGALVYEMATGKKAFEGKSQASVIAKILEIDPPPISTLQPMTPLALDRVVKTCLAKEPDERWQGASDLCRELKWIAGADSESAPSTSKQSKTIDSLAVLPLENVSGDPETEYLSDGMAETLMNALSQLRKIRIIPWAVSSQHRGPGVNPLRAGHQLGVRSVLSGRMVQRGEDLIVSVELVDVDRHARLWGGRYHRRMTDLVTLQEELTTEISEKLRLQLTGEERKKLRKRPTQNNEAFRLVLQAQHHGGGLSPDGLRKAIALCQQAIEIDPGYTAPHARLSTTYLNLGIHGYAAPADVYPKAMAAAKKALELDETFADAHVSLAFCLILQNWDFTSAKRELQRSLELNPDLAIGFALLSFTQQIEGRFDEAIASGKRAVELAPADFTPSLILGTGYLNARRFDEAIEELRKTTEIDPGSARAHDLLAQAYAARGQREKAIEESDMALVLGRRATGLLLRKAVVCAMLGETGEARGILEEVERNWKPDGTSSFGIAAVHACLGEKDAAFEWLERALEERVAFLVFLKVAGFFDALHGDPRLDVLVKRIGIPG